MQINKIDNMNFNGFEFKNTHAKKVFNEKLQNTYTVTAQQIKEYMKEVANEQNKVIIDATNSKMSDSDKYLLFATFSNKENIIADYSYSSCSLQRFISRCAAEAGYRPF